MTAARTKDRDRALLPDLREVLAPPVLRRLFLARTISATGDVMTPVALAFAVLQSTGSASHVGLVLAARAMPSLLFLLHGGAVGDRYSRRKVMVLAQLVAAAAQCSTAVLLLADIDGVAWLCAAAAIRGATSAYFNPASTGATATVTSVEQRQTVYSVFALVGAVCEVAGPALAGALMAVVNPAWVVMIDAATFLASATLLLGSRDLGHRQVTSAVRHGVGHDVREGCRFVRRTTWLAALIASAAIYQFTLLSSLSVLGPLVATRSLGGPSAWAAVVSAMGLGGVLGGVIGLHSRAVYPMRLAYTAGALAAGPTLVLLALPAPLWAIVISEFCAGSAVTLFGTLESATISNQVPNDLLSRVDSVNRLGSAAIKPLGMAVVAPIAVVLGLRVTLLAAAAAGMLGMLAPLTLRSVRELRVAPEGSGAVANS